jgi:hypothetical protein
MSWFKWLFTSKYKKLLVYMDTQYKNKGGLHIDTGNMMFYIDFENMTIEAEQPVDEDITI